MIYIYEILVVYRLTYREKKTQTKRQKIVFTDFRKLRDYNEHAYLVTVLKAVVENTELFHVSP